MSKSECDLLLTLTYKIPFPERALVHVLHLFVSLPYALGIRWGSNASISLHTSTRAFPNSSKSSNYMTTIGQYFHAQTWKVLMWTHIVINLCTGAHPPMSAVMVRTRGNVALEEQFLHEQFNDFGCEPQV